MKSMSDVMLQAHFKRLRDELHNAKGANAGLELSNSEKLLKKIYNYLKDQSVESKLDEEGTTLLYEIAQLLDKLNLKY